MRRGSWWLWGSISPLSDSELSSRLAALSERLAALVSPAAAAWLSDVRAQIRSDASALARNFPAAGRKVGHGMLIGPPSAAIVRLPAGGAVLNPWRTDEVARVLLLLEDASREPTSAVERANDLYFVSDGRERIAILRALPLLPESEAALPAVRDALRANATDLFTAAICENAYTSRHLPDGLFFQAVLKSAFVGLRLGRIDRIEERTTPELARMLFAYVTERERAGRPVAADLWPLIALFPPAGTAERIRSRVEAAIDPEERHLLEVALERTER